MVNYKTVPKAELEKECDAMGLEKGSKAEMVMRVREAKDNEIIYDPNYPDAGETEEPGEEADPELAKMSAEQISKVDEEERGQAATQAQAAGESAGVEEENAEGNEAVMEEAQK